MRQLPRDSSSRTRCRRRGGLGASFRTRVERDRRSPALQSGRGRRAAGPRGETDSAFRGRCRTIEPLHRSRSSRTSLLPGAPFNCVRLAYRDVASSTNRLTLIAAILPAGTVTTHTLFCLKTKLDEESQHFLCGMFNSFVANYLVRMRVTTHVTVAIIDRLPLPKSARDTDEFRLMASAALKLAHDPADLAAGAWHQALAARIYGLYRSRIRTCAQHVSARRPKRYATAP